ncbi:MAG: Smr/MutS family protein [Spirochaetales bacterium]|nr:Smr/MutS family protein [Spirochaetales bacterium]
MNGFGDILDAWESESIKGRKKGTEVKNPPEKKVVSGKMEANWLDLYPPGDKDSVNKDPSDSESLHQRVNPERLPIEASLDLHGMTSAEALAATEKFLKTASRQGYKKVLLIHGKGYHSPGGKSILKKEVRFFLERSTFVSSFGYGDRFNGGKGASWVILNRIKRKG